jgi:hypothetical protein
MMPAAGQPTAAPGMTRTSNTRWSIADAMKSGLALTTVGDKLVIVAQPWGEDEAPGTVLLTVYRLEGNQLRRAYSIVQRPDTTPRQPGAGGGRGGVRKGSAAPATPPGQLPQPQLTPADPIPGVPPSPGR